MAKPRPIPDLSLGQYDFSKRNSNAVPIIERFANEIAGGILSGGLTGPPNEIDESSISDLIKLHSNSLQSMAHELIRIYETPHTMLLRDAKNSDNQFEDLGKDLIIALDTDFLEYLAQDFAGSISLAIATSFLPLDGTQAVMILKVGLAATLTWRLATTIVFYYHKSGWLGDPNKTYQRAKKLVPGFSTQTVKRVDLDIVRQDQDIFLYQVEQTEMYIRTLRKISKKTTPAEFRNLLSEASYPDDVAEAAIVKIFGQPSGLAVHKKVIDFASRINEASRCIERLKIFRRTINETDLDEFLRREGYPEEVVRAVLAANPGFDKTNKSLANKHNRIHNLSQDSLVGGGSLVVSENLAGEYDRVYDEMIEDKNRFLGKVANQFTPCFNAKILEKWTKEKPITPQAREAFVEWVEKQLESLGLAILDRKTMRPAVLRTTGRGDEWRIVPSGSNNASKSKADLTELLPLELTTVALRKRSHTDKHLPGGSKHREIG